MEFVEDQRKQNVVYCETRICPHLFCERGLTPDEVTVTVLEALEKAQTKFNVVVRLLLCFLKPRKGEKQLHCALVAVMTRLLLLLCQIGVLK